MPLDQLAAHGWRAGYGTRMPDYDPSIFVGQRLDRPDPLEVWKLLKGHYGLVYEMDDDPFSVDVVNTQAYPSYKDGVTLKTIAEGARVADLVTVTTEPLAEVFRKLNPDVRVVPNCIPASVLAIERPRHERLTIGYAAGSSHLRDLAMIARTWDSVWRETGTRGHFVGTDFRRMIGHEAFDATPWEPDPLAYYTKIDFDIGLAPISPCTFSDSKSHLKALEYAALGIPVVASDCPAYRDFVVHGVTGFLVSTQDEWREALMTLTGDEGLREAMGAKARELAGDWTLERNWWRWAECYSELL